MILHDGAWGFLACCAYPGGFYHSLLGCLKPIFTQSFIKEFTSFLLSSSHLPQLLLKSVPRLFFNFRIYCKFIESLPRFFFNLVLQHLLQKKLPRFFLLTNSLQGSQDTVPFYPNWRSSSFDLFKLFCLVCLESPSLELHLSAYTLVWASPSSPSSPTAPETSSADHSLVSRHQVGLLTPWKPSKKSPAPSCCWREVHLYL